nr:signal peptidase I [Liquorilactobacillus oeni]
MKHSLKRFRKKAHLDYWLPLIFFAFMAALFMKTYLIVPLQIEGNSMQPTLYSKEEALVMNFGKIHRFDVVTIKMPDGQTYIKRVIGMPGDELEYRNDQLYINGKVREEKFLRSILKGKHSPYTSDFKLKELIGTSRVPANEYFVLGDNRKISKDSRTFGPVKDNWIKGKAIIIYWPINRLRRIGHN